MKGPERQRSLPEVVTYAVSLAVLVLLVGGLGFLWMSGNEEPPLLDVEPRLNDIEQRGDGFYLPIAVTNQGDQSAQEVVVDVTVGEETRSFMIAIIPGGASRSGTVVFAQYPADGHVTSEVVSFIST